MSEIASVLTSRPVVLSRVPLQIDRDEVLRYQAYKSPVDHPADELPQLIEEALTLGETLMVPAAVYRAAPLGGHGRDLILLADGTQLHIPEIGRLWGRLATVGVAICTIGVAIEVRVRELFDAREFALAVMLDSVGSAAVESLAEYVNDLLCQVGIRESQRVTNRVSPGYAGWDVAEQPLLFRLCPGQLIGVTLSEHWVMTPAKTISFVVGIGPEARVDHYFTQCRRCWLTNCTFRRAAAERTVRRATPLDPTESSRRSPRFPSPPS